MNKISIFSSLIFFLPFLTGCSNNATFNEYSLYYSYAGNMKGIEIYCWNEKTDWYTGILPGTNRNKTTSEIEWLQNNLPCPIKQMREILKSYNDLERDNAFVCIVSTPPKDEELTHDIQLIYDNLDTYVWIYNKLGLNSNYR